MSITFLIFFEKIYLLFFPYIPYFPNIPNSALAASLHPSELLYNSGIFPLKSEYSDNLRLFQHLSEKSNFSGKIRNLYIHFKKNLKIVYTSRGSVNLYQQFTKNPKNVRLLTKNLETVSQFILCVQFRDFSEIVRHYSILPTIPILPEISTGSPTAAVVVPYNTENYIVGSPKKSGSGSPSGYMPDRRLAAGALGWLWA